MTIGNFYAPYAENVTIEGVGTEAELIQCGFRFAKAKSIEVRNLTFTDYPDKAVSLRGETKVPNESNREEVAATVVNYGNYWVHNNVFNAGKLNFDVRKGYVINPNDPSGESYKADDTAGSTECHNVTYCYNFYNKLNKAHLIGSTSNSIVYNYTLHHNYYKDVVQRVPKSRTANIHMYNNYYETESSLNVDQMEDAIVFSENNYFEGTKRPFKSTEIINGYIKSYNDEIVGVSNIVTFERLFFVDNDRNYRVDNTGRETNEGKVYSAGRTDIDYTNFDTNPELFYYDIFNNKSDVEKLTSAEQAKIDCINASGVLKKPKEVLLGDLDEDESITIIDVRLLLQTVMNADPNIEWTSSQLIVMDINRDNDVNIIDVRLLLQSCIN